MAGKERKRYVYIEEMINRYVQRAWSDAQMAEALGTDRSNVYRMRTEVLEYQMGIPIYEESRGRYRINREHFVSYVRLNPAESLALYLGGRRLQQQTKTGQYDVGSALKKLAEALRKPLMQNLVRSAQFVLDQEQDERQAQVMRVLVEGWINHRRVRIKHRKLHGDLRTYIVSPYQLEPAVWGDGTYLIGESDYHNDLATFKVARIESATLTAEPFTIPKDFDSHKLLQHAWGIWHTGQEPVAVQLKFSPYVTPRVKESIWHPEQTIQDDDDGGCIWQAEIAEWREMVPWVRGWGSDVEVLEPQPLRQLITGHVRRQAEIYGVHMENTTAQTRLLKLWGKTSTVDDLYHPALFHMIDVAHVSQQLLSPKASSRWRRILGDAFNSDAQVLFEWLPWFIALHDIGKISVPFQAQNSFQRARLEKLDFKFGSYSNHHKTLHHTLCGHLALNEWVKDFPDHWRQVILDVIAGHHGYYQRPEREQKRQWKTLQEPQEWRELRTEAVDVLRSIFLLNEPAAWPQPQNISAAIVALNGFTILCDWLGSDENYFPPTPYTTLLDYLPQSRRRARDRVQSAGFFTPTLSTVGVDFKELFGWQPRPLQEAVADIPIRLLAQPTLTIIEAPTGEGKTEAALTLAHRIGRQQGSDEMYIALPTTATSNAMFGRIQEHLRDRLGLSATSVRLIHGQDFLLSDDLSVKPLGNGEDQPAEHPALTWFQPKKRALLAPFGVGTIDQAELSALNVRHNALRLIGLAGKVVILDEVHAYDTYMTTIIKRMLQWLSALGCSVILLSATLPISRRKELLEAYGGDAVEFEDDEAYPLLICAGSQGHFKAVPNPIQPQKTIQLNFIHFNEDEWPEKARWLVEKAQDGGCVCWITNTVHRAQQMFLALKAIIPQDIEYDLLHARFPVNERQKLEEVILRKYGKEEIGNRPQKAIIIGTQVLEQSLDIDFDLLVSDLAPVDLVLQRIGRLHRHLDRTNRSHAHPNPHVYINAEVDQAGQVVEGTDKFYTLYLLQKSWLALQALEEEQGAIILPADYRPLVEQVYEDSQLEENTPLKALRLKRHKKETIYEDEAELRLSNKPEADWPFWKGQRAEFKEDEESNNWIVAQTRYQEQESITLIPLKKVDNHFVRLSGQSKQIRLDEPLNRSDQIELLRHSLKVSNRTAVEAIKAQAEAEGLPALFTRSSLLKHCYPLWLVDRTWISMEDQNPVVLTLDPELGLLIE